MSELDTSIIQVPEANVTIESFQEQVDKLLVYSQARVVICDDDAKGATDDLSMMVSLKKNIEERRKEYVGPLNDKVKVINNLFKTITEPLEQADQITRKKVLDYRAEQERQRREAEAINQAKQDLARREMELKGEITVDTKPVEVPQAPAKVVRGALGSAGTAKVWKWMTEDFTKIPDQFKTTDDKKILKAVQGGQAIPGIKAWQEESLRVR
jgi:hypothetical protein